MSGLGGDGRLWGSRRHLKFNVHTMQRIGAFGSDAEAGKLPGAVLWMEMNRYRKRHTVRSAGDVARKRASILEAGENLSPQFANGVFESRHPATITMGPME